MTTNHKVIVGLILAVGLLVIGVALGRSVAPTQLLSGTYEAIPKWFGNGLSAGLTEQWSVDDSGDVTTSGTQTINGVMTTTKRSTYTAATTTVCALQSPAATSTLVYAGASFTTSSTTASIVTLAKATTAYATTTALGASAVAANAQATIIASTTPTANLTVFAPSTYLVVGMQGGGGTFSPSGACFAEFKSTI